MLNRIYPLKTLLNTQLVHRLHQYTNLDWLILIGNLGVLVGFVLYGATTLQARVLPRWCGVELSHA